MTNLITLTIPNDDHIALRAFGKALEEIALAHDVEPRKTTIDTSAATAALEHLNNATAELMQTTPQMMDTLRFDGEELQGKRKEPEADTTAQQVESLVERIEENLEVAEQPFQGEVVPTTPWDERIHSASKALNADGTWRLRRKPKDMDEAQWAAFVETVKAESSEGLETPPEAYLTDDNNYVIAKSDAEAAELESNGYTYHTREQYDAWEGPNTADAGIPSIPVPPPVVVAPPVPVIPTGEALDVLASIPVITPEQREALVNWDFPRLMTFLTERHGKIDVATVNTLLAQDGLASLQELNAHPDKIGSFVARVKTHLGE